MHDIEHAWSSKRLLVVGDVMLDKYIWGEVGRISPEAPVPVVRCMRQDSKPGGAANVAMNLARLGAKTTIVGITGGDESEAQLIASLESNSITPRLISAAEFPTVTKSRILSGSQQMLRLDFERLGSIEPSTHDKLLETALALLPEADALVISDYAKGAVTPAFCRALITAARQRNIPVLVDPKSADFSRYRGATTICPNLGELCRAARLDTINFEAALVAGESMVTALDIEFLTATLSDKGIALDPSRKSLRRARAGPPGLRRLRRRRHRHRSARALPRLGPQAGDRRRARQPRRRHRRRQGRHRARRKARTPRRPQPADRPARRG